MKKISKVLWAGENNDLLEIHYEDGTSEYCSASPNPLYDRVKKQFTRAKITAETEEYKRYFAEREQRFQDFNDHYEEWRAFKNNRLGAAPFTMENVLNISKDKEALFKIKLDVFELDEVKNSKKRAWKASMRKAKTALELLALLHQELPDLGNEQDEPLGEIPLRDITNQENTQDSVQDSDGQSSDAPIE